MMEWKSLARHCHGTCQQWIKSWTYMCHGVAHLGCRFISQRTGNRTKNWARKKATRNETNAFELSCSFVPKQLRRLDLQNPPGRHITRRQRDEREARCNGGQRERIRRRDT